MLDKNHAAALEAALFGRVEAPGWLSSSVRDCQARYSELSLTEEFQSAIKAFDIRADVKPFELFVVGEGKFGKSTLVNCLLGEELSRVRVLPETRCFLRYVLKGTPAQVARFYVRPKKGMHDWLIKVLGSGRTVPDLYRVSEYEVNLLDAKRILAEEIARLDGGNYEPAILEVERDVMRSGRSAFRNEIRIVDTQGLDQLFPDELKKKTAGLSESTSQELFIEWMNTTPRGKYLEWQFRRCDSVLWCVSAVRIGSAATAAALRYFSAYSKKIVIALTAVDRVAKNDADLNRLLARAHELYGPYVADIRPVNGSRAWEAIVSNDAAAIVDTGFLALVNSIDEICVSQGNKVRNLSRYFAIRRTERQYRSALRTLHATYKELDARYKQDRRTIEKSRDRAKEATGPLVRKIFSEISSEIATRIGLIVLSDDQSDAESKVGFSSAGRSAAAAIRDVISSELIPDLTRVGNAIAPYSLPSFDADGRVAGSQIRVQFHTPRTSWNSPISLFSFSLESLWGKSTWLAIKAFFGSKRALEERLALEQQRRNQLSTEFRKHWNAHLSMTSKGVLAEIDRLYEILLTELDTVLRRVEKEAGSPLPVAKKKIEGALAAFAVLPAVSNGMVRAIERARNRVD